MDFFKTVKLKPSDVDIEGIDQPVPITRFTWEEWDEIVSPKIDQQNIEVAVMYMINPVGYEHTDEDVATLKKTFGIPQIVDIYKKALAVNGVSVGSGEEAKKN